MRVGNTDLLRLLVVIASMAITSCATQKIYHGMEATNLSGLFYGMTRLEAEKITGKHKKETQCDAGSIVTYIYDRGYRGCINSSCDPDRETIDQYFEIVGDFFTLGLATYSMSQCRNPCQKGNLQLFFDKEGYLIGVREMAPDKDNWCRKRDRKAWGGISCSSIYWNRKPSTVPKTLILAAPAATLTIANSEDRLCELYPEKNLVWLCQAADQGHTNARIELGKLYFYGSDQYHGYANIHIPADLSRSCMWFHLAGQAQITEQPDIQAAELTSAPYNSNEVERTAKVMSAHEIDEAEKLVLAWKPGQCDRDFSLFMVTEYAKDPALAKLCTAADQGDFSSRDELGRIYFLGSRGVKPDLPRAYMWYHLAAKVYVPPTLTGGRMQTLCDAMTPEQRSKAVKLLEEWKPGKCEQYLQIE
jgi:hypothetical protein